jgi:tripartite-type tricarboxylate transporter receptor subunit TctC
MVTAHYRGIGPAFQDLLGSQVQVMTPGLAAGLPHIRSRKVTPVAITGRKRHPLVPDVPTFEELGYKGFDALQWYGIVGPAKMPPAVTKRLNDEINKILATPAFQQRLSAEAIDPMPMAPEQFGKYIQAEIARYTALARERKINLDD